MKREKSLGTSGREKVDQAVGKALSEEARQHLSITCRWRRLQLLC